MKILVNYEQVGCHWLAAEYADGYLTATSTVCTSETDVIAWAETRAGLDRYVERINERTLAIVLRTLPHEVCKEDGIRSSVSVRVF